MKFFLTENAFSINSSLLRIGTFSSQQPIQASLSLTAIEGSFLYFRYWEEMTVASYIHDIKC